ncbi:MAG: hypothetical protein ACXWTU_02235 [Methylotenera sp.]
MNYANITVTEVFLPQLLI